MNRVMNSIYAKLRAKGLWPKYACQFRIHGTAKYSEFLNDFCSAGYFPIVIEANEWNTSQKSCIAFHLFDRRTSRQRNPRSVVESLTILKYILPLKVSRNAFSATSLPDIPERLLGKLQETPLHWPFPA